MSRAWVSGSSGVDVDEDRPVASDHCYRRLPGPCWAVGPIKQVDGQYSAKPQRCRDGPESALDGRCVRQIAQHVSRGHYGVDHRGLVVGQGKPPERLHAGAVSRASASIGRRRIGRDDAVTGGHQMSGQCPGPAAELQYHPATPASVAIQRGGRVRPRNLPRLPLVWIGLAC